MLRLLAGLIAIVIGGGAGLTIAAIEAKVFGSWHPQVVWGSILLVGLSVFWLADRLGFMKQPEHKPTIGLRQ